MVAICLIGAGVWFSTQDAPASQYKGAATTTNEAVIDESSYSTSSVQYKIEADLVSSSATSAQEVNDVIRGVIDDFIALAKENNQTRMYPNGEIRPFTMDVVTERHVFDSLTSYYVEFYEYTGGAHGNAVVDTFVYNTEGGMVELTDIIDSTQVAVLLSAVKAGVYEQFGRDGAFVDSVENLTIEELDFYIDNSQIYVVFSQYDVAPGAAGVVEIVLDLEKYQEPAVTPEDAMNATSTTPEVATSTEEATSSPSSSP